MIWKLIDRLTLTLIRVEEVPRKISMYQVQQKILYVTIYIDISVALGLLIFSEALPPLGPRMKLSVHFVFMTFKIKNI